MPTQQLTFVPEVRPQVEDCRPALSELPDDEWLYGPAPTKELVDSIRAYGVLEPILVVDYAGGLNVADGRRRVKAARLAGLTDIPARRVVTDAESWAWLPSAVSLMAHATRRDNPAADITAIGELIEQGATEAEIRAATGLPVQTIRKRQRLLALMPELLLAVLHGEIAVSVAEEAVKLPAALQTSLLRKLAENGRVTASDVAELRRVQVSSAGGQALTLAGLDQLPSADDVLDAAGSTDAPAASKASLGRMMVKRETLDDVLTAIQRALNQRDTEPLKAAEVALLELLEG